MWKIWCKALGTKEGKSNREADAVAVIRTLILLGYMITNCFIVAGVVRHWNPGGSTLEVSPHRIECVSNDTKEIKK
jgi:hypothetical protein